MNQGNYSFPNRRPLPIDSSTYEFNFTPLPQNSFFNNFNNQQNINSYQEPSNFTSLYNQFITDAPLNGSLKSNNSRLSQSRNSNSRQNLTFFNDDYQESQSDASSYENIALQAQQLLDKLNHEPQISPNNPGNIPSNSYGFKNLPSYNSNETSQSSPPSKLQPILQNARFLPNISYSNNSQNNLNPPITSFENNFNFSDACQDNKNQPNFENNFNFSDACQDDKNHLNFGNDFNFTDSCQDNKNQPNFGNDFNFSGSQQSRGQNLPKQFFSNGQINGPENAQFQKSPRLTFASPNFLNDNNNFQANVKRLSTASEMIYPDNHVEFLQHSKES